MKHYGDITHIDGAAVELTEVVIGGSPCQDLSVAGKRAGLAGERSGLFMEQIRIIKEMRRESERSGADVFVPRYMVWENVPGAFSSNKGEDFRAVLEETARVVDSDAIIPRPPRNWTNAGVIMGNGWSIAWRVHDAQFWGVPQRRRRIALVADFGGYTAPKILFERNSLSRNTSQSETSWKDFTAAAAKRFGTTNREERRIVSEQAAYCIQGNCIDRSDTAGCNGKGWTEDKSYTLNTIDRHAVCNVGVLDDQGGHIISAIDDGKVSPTLRAQMHGYAPCVYDARGNGNEDVALSITGDHSRSISDYTNIVCMATQQGNAEIRTDDKSPTITAAAGMSGNNQPIVVYNGEQITNPTNHSNPKIGDSCHTLGTTGANRCILCYGFRHKAGAKAGGIGYEKETSPSLTAQQNDAAIISIDRAAYNQGKNAKYNIEIDESGISQSLVAKGPGAVMCNAAVRRLTPLECCRLDGYPDGWTDIGEWTDTKGKNHKTSDASEYRAYGNSIALPFWVWLLERIMHHTKHNTMASLFDGIGGFPLIWETLGGKCVWASEIEEFCIAVTKKRFGKD